MATTPTLSELLKRRDDINKRRDKLNKKIREAQSAEATKLRKERTHRMIQRGGLIAIAEEVVGHVMSDEMLLGGLMYLHNAANSAAKPDMLSDWEDKGRTALIGRAALSARAKKTPAAAPPTGGEEV